MAFRGKTATKEPPKKVAKPTKEYLSLSVSLEEWDIEEGYKNKQGTFGIYKLSRDGWQSYDVVLFADAIKTLETENPASMLLSLGWTKPPNGENWTYRLQGSFEAVPF